MQYTIPADRRQEKTVTVPPKNGHAFGQSAKKAIRSVRRNLCQKVIRGTSSPASRGISATTSPPSPAVTVSVPRLSPGATGASTDSFKVTVCCNPAALDFSSSSAPPSPSTGWTVAWVPRTTGTGARATPARF